MLFKRNIILFLVFFSNLCFGQKVFKASSDSVEVLAQFNGADSLVVTIKNLSFDSIYIPHQNILKLFSEDTIVNECNIQIGFVSPGDCKTSSLMRRILPKEEHSTSYLIRDNDSFRNVNLSVSLQFLYARKMLTDFEGGIELNDKLRIGDCLLNDISEKISLSVFYSH